MEETIQIVQTSIFRSSVGLKDWQVDKVSKDYEDKKFYLYPKKDGIYNGKVDSASIKSQAYEEAFQKEDWDFFDREFDAALTFAWV